VLLPEKPRKLSFSRLHAELKARREAVLDGCGGPVANPAVDPPQGLRNDPANIMTQ
jgi:hypothetical protein